ncbi:MAG TPA: ATP-dependent DNA ligase [Gemmatales bacterium]|nr:ATP-dependent DNA ligase [Gemmatales bacterium]HMP57894.1 ATP-dependent DNA ligase [Gemmatales bacterium]
MRRFAQLFSELDATTKTSVKEAALERYFRTAEPQAAAWALSCLLGRRAQRPVSGPTLRAWAAAEANLPSWLVDQCVDNVGDHGEALALLLPPPSAPADLSLVEVIENRLLVLRDLDEAARRSVVVRTWQQLGPRERFLFHKLLGGTFRVGVAQSLLTRALARIAQVDPATMAHRLAGEWSPSVETWERLLAPADSPHACDPGQPYPFQLAYPLDGPPADLGPVADWQCEWKWDGIRAQFLCRRGEVLLWSRGEELLNASFPDVVAVAQGLPDGTVLDGELLAWRAGQPLPFAQLQRRLGRKRPDARLLRMIPVTFLAYDLLELDGVDVRGLDQAERRLRLEELFVRHGRHGLLLAPLLQIGSWEEAHASYAEAEARQVEGLMLKRRAATYGVGRVRGAWWKWKRAPRTVDAVLIGAQLGRGKRAGLYTDYTFGVWHGGELAPIAKAYTGLSDAEIQQVDRFIKQNTVGQFGPVRMVRPKLVFELAFEGIQRSPRHKSGLALRFPRMARWRQDKTVDQADVLATLQALLPLEPMDQPLEEPLGGLFANVTSPESSS